MDQTLEPIFIPSTVSATHQISFPLTRREQIRWVPLWLWIGAFSFFKKMTLRVKTNEARLVQEET